MQGNTSSPEEDHQQGLQAGKKYVADPSQKGRVGIYIGETSRSLSERAGEHYRDARDFSKKSHIIKHWMNNHQDEDKIPPFIIKITKNYQDCLSRQVGEAIAIHMSRDELLNSKNEYASNCISRVGVEETTFERKQREWEEETDEKKEEERLDAFRKAKEGKSNHKDYGRGNQRATDPDGEEEIPRNNKRNAEREETVPGGWKGESTSFGQDRSDGVVPNGQQISIAIINGGHNIITTPKRKFHNSIVDDTSLSFSPSKRQKFSENLQFWRANEKISTTPSNKN